MIFGFVCLLLIRLFHVLGIHPHARLQGSRLAGFPISKLGRCLKGSQVATGNQAMHGPLNMRPFHGLFCLKAGSAPKTLKWSHVPIIH